MDISRKEILALIPARGGSKSIPHKNIRLFAGKPLIAHTIERARQSRLITRVIVSTDDREIADIAKKYGAEVPFLRPKELARDVTPDLPVFEHALAWLENTERYAPHAIVQLRPTTPMRRIETIDRAIELYLHRPDADSLRSVSPTKKTPFKMYVIKEGEFLEPVIKLGEGVESYNMPRQSLPKTYWGNGYIDITRQDVMVKSKSMYGTRILSFVIDEPCIDIDDEEDLRAAEQLMRAMDNSSTLRHGT